MCVSQSSAISLNSFLFFDDTGVWTQGLALLDKHFKLELYFSLLSESVLDAGGMGPVVECLPT
jgi:hypothetical protein